MVNWVISANPKMFDVEGAFNELRKVDWRQSASIEVGDIVYIYVSGDVKGISNKY